MNKVFRFLSLGILAIAFAAAGAVSSFAQDPCADTDAQQTKYKEFTDNYDKPTVEARKVALNASKEYVEKYGACPDAKTQVDYFKTYIPTAEKQIKDMEAAAGAKAYNDMMAPLYARFNNALKAKNWDEVYAGGKAVLEKEKDQQIALDITIVLGTVGFNETTSAAKNEKYNADTLKYAADAIKRIEGGQTSKAYGIKSGTTFVGFNTKEEAVGSLNYIIGYLTANTGAKNPKAALPYLYTASQSNSNIKKLPDTYQLIGVYYIDEIIRLEKDRQVKLDANKNVDTDETKAIVALQKGYADRALDALAKAYQATDAVKEKDRKAFIYKNIEFAYEARNGNKTGLNPAYVSSLTSKPLVNPTTEVTPVVETPPAETTTPTTDTTGTTKPAATTAAPATTKPATTKPAATTPTATPAKPAVSTTKPVTSGETAVKTPAKKPAPKKKGTR